MSGGPKAVKMFEVLEFIRTFIADKGYAPSGRQIAEHFNFKSINSAYLHLAALERHGKIERAHGVSRAIRVVA